MKPTDASPLRPVTPHAILAARLTALVARVEAAGGLAPEALAELRAVERLAAGLDPYLDAHTTPPSPALAALEAATLTQDWPALHRAGETAVELESEMLCGAVEARFLATLVGLTGAKRVLEVGMFTGYSALAMAEAMPPDGRLIALEREPWLAAFARPFFDAAGCGDRIEVRVGPALDEMRRLADAGAQFDLIFIDAHKAEYVDYCRLALAGLLAPGGVIAVDNTLLQGEPWRGDSTDRGVAIDRFNRAVRDDPRVAQVLVPLRDGITLVRRVAP